MCWVNILQSLNESSERVHHQSCLILEAIIFLVDLDDCIVNEFLGQYFEISLNQVKDPHQARLIL